MKKEISYFRSLLEQYLNEHHPEMMNSRSFIENRAEAALTTYADAVKNGITHPEAEMQATEVLYKGLLFSAYDMIVEILWNEFSDTIPQGLAERLAAILLGSAGVRNTIASYQPDDEFDSSPDYDLLYTELTGVIELIIEKNELPVFGSAKV